MPSVPRFQLRHATAFRALLLFALVPEVAVAMPPQGRPLTIEDYYRVKTVGSPEISADGRWVAFTVTDRFEPLNSNRTKVWLVAADGSAEARQVSPTDKQAGSVSWASDGRLRFVAGDSAFFLDPDDPDAGLAAAPERPEGNPSPDGRWIARVQPVRPSAPEPDDRLTDFERRHEERFRGVQFDWLNFQRDGAEFPVPDGRDPAANPPSEIFLEPTDGGDARQLTNLGLQPRSVIWSPDGTAMVFAADVDYRNERTYGRADLFRVDIASGAVTRLTPDDGLNNRSPRFSPDGRRIAFVRSFGTDKIIAEELDHGGPTDLYVMPAAGGQLTNLTEDWNLQAGAADWSPDGRWLYLTTQTGGSTHLFRISPDNHQVEQVTTGDRRVTGLSFDDDFRHMVYLVHELDALPEVHIANIDGSAERRLTNVHEDFLAEISLSRGEGIHFESYDGTPVEGFLLFPRGYQPDGGPYPLIVSSHGGPHSSSGHDFNFKLQFFAAQGYFVLETNFRSSTGYGDDFLWATWGGWGTKDGQDVVSGIDYVIANYPVDPDRVGHTGHSYGGFMTNWLITQYPDRFAAAISGAGISNWISDYGTADIARTKETEFFGYPWEDGPREIMIRQSPLTHAGRVRTPTLFVHGENDQRVPYEEAEQMYTALKKIGVPARMIIYEGMAHGIRGHWNNVHRMINELKWWDRWLKPGV